MKPLRKMLEQLLSPLTLGLLIAIVFSLFTSRYYSSPEDFEPVSRINQAFYNARMTLRGPRSPHPDIVVLAVDDRSLQQEGRWPWPRQKVAELVRRAMESGAKLIAFDMVFSEEDPNSSRPALIEVQKKISKRGITNPDISEVIEDQLSTADSDLILGNTIKSYSDRLVLGTLYERELDYKSHSPTSEICYNIIARNTTADEYWRHNEDILILTPVELKIPDPLITHYKAYFFDVLEQDAIKGWLSENANTAQQVESLVNLIGEPLSKELIPVLLTYWANGTLAKVELPEPANSMFAEGVNDIFNLSRRASIFAELARVKRSYCDRFLTSDDELLSEAAFIKANQSSEGFENYDLARAWPEIQKKSSSLAELSLDAFVAKYRAEATHSTLTPTEDWRVNIEKIARSKKHSGFFNATVDNDGVIRSATLISRYGESYIPSLALKSIAALTHTIPAVDWKLKRSNYSDELSKSKRPRVVRSPSRMWLRDEDENVVLKLPIDPQGRMLINYAGKARTFPHVSAADILADEETLNVSSLAIDDELRSQAKKKANGSLEKDELPANIKLKSEYLKDKILVLGPTALAVFDMRVTPFEENYPGVETHANALSNLLIEYQRQNGTAPANSDSVPGFLKFVPTESVYMPVALLILGAVVAFVISYFGAIVGLLFTAGTMIAIYLVDHFVFFERGLVISAAFPIFLTGTQYVVLTFHKYFTEERKKRELKGVFEKYVSPSIVAEVLSHPENLELGGRKQELTVMFSDVRGFTTISEKLDPRELSNLLSNYLTPMTQLVFKNKGTLDKYMGDAIMAFFGAPVKYPEHAKWACRCALESLVKLKELQELFKSQGLPEIDIGIGLNTGEVSVGNMGSDTVQSYTVMGDAVNLASRLEGINKEYGTRIVISEFTQKALGPEFFTRQLDLVRVKGKAQPVKIYELVGEGSIPEQTQLTLQAFAEGFSFYHKQQWNNAIAAFEKALSHSPNDPPSELYLDRCREYLSHPPPADWDGVFTMTTK